MCVCVRERQRKRRRKTVCVCMWRKPFFFSLIISLLYYNWYLVASSTPASICSLSLTQSINTFPVLFITNTLTHTYTHIIIILLLGIDRVGASHPLAKLSRVIVAQLAVEARDGLDFVLCVCVCVHVNE